MDTDLRKCYKCFQDLRKESDPATLDLTNHGYPKFVKVLEDNKGIVETFNQVIKAECQDNKQENIEAGIIITSNLANDLSTALMIYSLQFTDWVFKFKIESINAFLLFDKECANTNSYINSCFKCKKHHPCLLVKENDKIYVQCKKELILRKTCWVNQLIGSNIVAIKKPMHFEASRLQTLATLYGMLRALKTSFFNIANSEDFIRTKTEFDGLVKTQKGLTGKIAKEIEDLKTKNKLQDESDKKEKEVKEFEDLKTKNKLQDESDKIEKEIESFKSSKNKFKNFIYLFGIIKNLCNVCKHSKDYGLRSYHDILTCLFAMLGDVDGLVIFWQNYIYYFKPNPDNPFTSFIYPNYIGKFSEKGSTGKSSQESFVEPNFNRNKDRYPQDTLAKEVYVHPELKKLLKVELEKHQCYLYSYMSKVPEEFVLEEKFWDASLFNKVIDRDYFKLCTTPGNSGTLERNFFVPYHLFSLWRYKCEQFVGYLILSKRTLSFEKNITGFLSEPPIQFDQFGELWAKGELFGKSSLIFCSYHDTAPEVYSVASPSEFSFDVDGFTFKFIFEENLSAQDTKTNKYKPQANKKPATKASKKNKDLESFLQVHQCNYEKEIEEGEDEGKSSFKNTKTLPKKKAKNQKENMDDVTVHFNRLSIGVTYKGKAKKTLMWEDMLQNSFDFAVDGNQDRVYCKNGYIGPFEPSAFDKRQWPIPHNIRGEIVKFWSKTVYKILAPIDPIDYVLFPRSKFEGGPMPETVDLTKFRNTVKNDFNLSIITISRTDFKNFKNGGKYCVYPNKPTFKETIRVLIDEPTQKTEMSFYSLIFKTYLCEAIFPSSRPPIKRDEKRLLAVKKKMLRVLEDKSLIEDLKITLPYLLAKCSSPLNDVMSYLCGDPSTLLKDEHIQFDLLANYLRENECIKRYAAMTNEFITPLFSELHLGKKNSVQSLSHKISFVDGNIKHVGVQAGAWGNFSWSINCIFEQGQEPAIECRIVDSNFKVCRLDY